MLGEPEYSMNELFAQLGLDSSDEAIDAFIKFKQNAFLTTPYSNLSALISE